MSAYTSKTIEWTNLNKIKMMQSIYLFIYLYKDSFINIKIIF